MLANALVCATLPTTDLDRAKRFYGDMLGLPEADFGVEGGVFYTAGAGTMFRVYERPPSTAEHRSRSSSLRISSRRWPSCEIAESPSRSTACRA